jgi:hypothetical protein
MISVSSIARGFFVRGREVKAMSLVEDSFDDNPGERQRTDDSRNRPKQAGF